MDPEQHFSRARERESQVGSNTGDWDHKRDFSVRSGLNLTRSLSMNFNYAQNVSSNRRGSGMEQRSMSRDYLSYGKHLENGFPFVGWSVRLTGLERNKFISKFVRTMSMDHATHGKETRAWQFDQFSGPSIPFFGLKPIEDWVSCTSILAEPSALKDILNGNWKSLPKLALEINNSWDDEGSSTS